jgi:hypothetical protein
MKRAWRNRGDLFDDAGTRLALARLRPDIGVEQKQTIGELAAKTGYRY